MKQLILLPALLLAGLKLMACNTCGCAASNQFLGLLPEMNRSFIGVQYNYRWYESFHDATEPTKSGGREYYQSMQIWGRYNLGERVQLFGFLPFQYNIKQEEGIRTVLKGMGDASFLANVLILAPKKSKPWSQSLSLGIGTKAPTGAYNDMVLGSGDLLAPSMQAGTGSWDFLGDLDYSLRYRTYGLHVEAGFTRTTVNHQDYKYGNRKNGGLQIFRQIQLGSCILVPSLGMRYDYSAQDYDNYSTRSLAAYTGGYMSYGMAGAQLYVRHWSVDVSYSLPVAQQYGGGLVKSLGKMGAGINYVF